MTSNSKAYSTNDLELFETHRKSSFVAYIALLLTGAVGGHRHYLGYGGTGFVQTVLGLTALVSAYNCWPYVQDLLASPESPFILDDQTLIWFLTGLGATVLLGLWLLADMFRIPKLAARKNRDLIARLSHNAPADSCPTDIIAKFAALRANGTISEEEFIACKQQIMGIQPAAAAPQTGSNSPL